VRAFAGRMRERGIKPQALEALRLAAVGPVTAAVLSSALRPPDAIAATASASSLGLEVPVEPGSPVLVPHGDQADDTLANALRARGAIPHLVLAYRTVPGEGVPRIAAGVRDGRIDALLLASGSAIRFIAESVDLIPRAPARGTDPRPAIFCIGPSTARVAAEIGWRVDGIATDTTQPALIDVVTRWFAERQRSA
jgi:uroporphyrinogen-III synthase